MGKGMSESHFTVLAWLLGNKPHIYLWQSVSRPVSLKTDRTTARPHTTAHDRAAFTTARRQQTARVHSIGRPHDRTL